MLIVSLQDAPVYCPGTHCSTVLQAALSCRALQPASQREQRRMLCCSCGRHFSQQAGAKLCQMLMRADKVNARTCCLVGLLWRLHVGKSGQAQCNSHAAEQ